MTHKISRFEVNAAINRLIARTDTSGEAARAVIGFGSSLPSLLDLLFKLSFSSHDGSEDPLATIWASLQDHEVNEIRETITTSVGSFRIWKEKEGLLAFQHHPESTNGESPRYHLKYDPKTLVMKYFGIERSSVVLRIGFISFFRTYLEVISGTKMFKHLDFGIDVA